MPLTPDTDVNGLYTGRGNGDPWGQRHADILRRIIALEFNTISDVYDRGCHLALPCGQDAHGCADATKSWIGLRSTLPNATFTIEHQIGREDGFRPDIAVSGVSANSAEYQRAAAVVDQVFGSSAPANAGNTELPTWFGQSPAGNVGDLDAQERDVVIRTILGEASGESFEGQAAVASVIRNRVADPRFANDAIGVTQAPQQFSACNSGAGGNDLVNRYGPGDANYERVGQIGDQVWSGQVRDNTGGATHYCPPAGMLALVSNGSQSNLIPRWLDEQNNQRGYQILRSAIETVVKSEAIVLGPAHEDGFDIERLENVWAAFEAVRT